MRENDKSPDRGLRDRDWQCGEIVAGKIEDSISVFINRPKSIQASGVPVSLSEHGESNR
jgi:hypothetical protein